MATIAIIWTIGAAMAAACFARALAVRVTSKLAEGLWYTFGSYILVCTCLLWASLEPNAVPQQRLILIGIGALAGALTIYTAGESFRPRISGALSVNPQILQAQLTSLRDIESFFGGVDEYKLRELFDLPDMVKYNILEVRQSLDRSHFPPVLKGELDGYFSGGRAIINSHYASISRMPNGSLGLNPMPGKVWQIVTSKKFEESKDLLARFIAMPELPLPIVTKLKNVDSLIDQDTDLMFVCFNDILQTNASLFMGADNNKSGDFVTIWQYYNGRMVSLAPTVREVLQDIRSYLGTQ
jgi:hypothetical protein